MILRDRLSAFAMTATLIVVPTAPAGARDALDAPTRAHAPFEIPHTADLALASHSRRDRRPGNVEPSALLDPVPGLEPLAWPRNGDMRARLVTPQLRRTPVVGWIASNLYRSTKETGWCLEVDPGQGEYLISYRLNLR